MTIEKAELKSAAQQQKDLWNSSGPHVVRKTYTPPAGTHWCVVGLVMADGFDPDTDEAALETAVEVLAAVTAMANPRIYGVVPAVIEAAGHEAVVYATATASYQEGPTDEEWSSQGRKHRSIKPPVAKQWMTLVLTLPAKLDHAGIADLETALEEITGITTAKHMMRDSLSTDAVSPVVELEGRMRIDPISE